VASGPPKWSSCRILVVSRQEKKRYAKIIEQLQGASVLTLRETADFMAAGGMVTMLLRSGTKVQFEVNLDATDKARLKISTGLLSLARRVVQTKTAAAKS
jgi:YfiR/HmsC-like